MAEEFKNNKLDDLFLEMDELDDMGNLLDSMAFDDKAEAEKVESEYFDTEISEKAMKRIKDMFEDDVEDDEDDELDMLNKNTYEDIMKRLDILKGMEQYDMLSENEKTLENIKENDEEEMW